MKKIQTFRKIKNSSFAKTAIRKLGMIALTMAFVSASYAQNRIPGWLAAGWYDKDANPRYWDEFVFKLDNKGNLTYNVNGEAKTISGVTVNITSDDKMFGKKEGSMSYTIDGRSFSINFSDEVRIAGTATETSGNTTQLGVSRTGDSYGPLGVLVQKLTFSGAQGSDPIFGKMNNKTLYRNDGKSGGGVGMRGLSARP
ncbi:MAG: hypothetical protein FWG79_09065, partial [Bacteroidales bacterium]|nr:hypothetical protein [Bacteroidales bacterium]